MQFLQRNNRACSLGAVLCAAVGLAAPASAGGGNPIAVLDVTGNAAINAEISTFIGSSNVSDNGASVMGTISLASSDFSTVPGDLELVDLDLMLNPSAMPMGGVDGGQFLGSADPVGFSLSGVSLAPEIPEEIESGGLATFTFDLALAGEAFATYDLIGVDPVENAMVDLATIDSATGRLEIFTLNSSLGELTVEATLFFETVTIPFEPGIVEIYITDASTMTLTATGEDPTAEPPNFCSIADLAEPCGTIDLADIGVFVDGFTMNLPIADLNRDGIFDLEDITAFVTGFQNNDCPGTDTYYCYYGGTGMAAIEFHNGNSAYAFGDHTTLTAGIALSGAALMLGFGSFRRKQA